MNIEFDVFCFFFNSCWESVKNFHEQMGYRKPS